MRHVLTNVRNVHKPSTHVPNVFLEEMYHHIVTVHQENLKKKICHVKIVTGNVLNVKQHLIHVPLVEVIDN